MSLILESHAARLPELGGSERDAFVLFSVGGERAYVATGYRSPDARVGETRAPLCLAIAIDASSSMRGARFALAIQATQNVIASLGPQDHLAVVTFDRSARVVFGPLALTEEGRAQASRSLDRLATGIGTNLGLGWREASEAVLRVMIPNTMRRVLLLTDGYPSRGETQAEILRSRVAEGFSKGVETSVVGICDGIDERLCSSLASVGEGRFHYVRDEDGLADVVAAEVDGAKALIARDVNLSFALSSRIERAELMHRYTCRPEGRTMIVRVGTLTRDNPRVALFSVGTEASGEAMLGAATAVGKSTFQRDAQLSNPTAAGYALGTKSLVSDGLEESEQVTVSLGSGVGFDDARRRVSWELLVQRTLAEIRSAWDAMDTGDKEAVSRRLDRARTLRRTLVNHGLVPAHRLASLPDVDVVQESMFMAGGASREARKHFTAWAHNTQVSFVGVVPKIPVGK
jgi:Mg-chelatase subunit ChlD